MAVNDRDIFNNVTELSIHTDKTVIYDDYLSYEGLPSQETWFELLTTNKIEPMISYFSNVRHLDMSHVRKLKSSSVLLEILKGTPRLSSLTITSDLLQSLWNDNELCQYFNRMIHQLDVTNPSYFMINRTILEKFCQVFSNVEYLQCGIGDKDQIFFILEYLSKLIRADFFLEGSARGIDISQLEQEIRQLSMNVYIDRVGFYSTTMVWIDRTMADIKQEHEQFSPCRFSIF
ncbi:unnamed protein product [Didymodactylos carnosus]|uniref:Uncharacterized protein n=1 Tax=Didymodactylos carnosus TaxID=1234261 RepID=A0A8S2DIF4_9BILA|nr:unnamed protein product [Didymodactylos carnosus]CAF3747757.1 unnamed protein product [Didymodactylos carnosus]